MEIDKWVGPHKVRVFPWVDGERIYCNVQYYKPGQSIENSPVWDKTVYLTNNDAGRNIVSNFLHSLVEHIANMQISKGTEVTITA